LSLSILVVNRCRQSETETVAQRLHRQPSCAVNEGCVTEVT